MKEVDGRRLRGDLFHNIGIGDERFGAPVFGGVRGDRVVASVLFQQGRGYI